MKIFMNARGLSLALLAALSVCASAESLFIKNAQVHTISSAGVLDKANILIRDGKIVGVGAEVTADSDSKLIDAKGKPVTPGLMNAYSYLGTVELELVAATSDHGTSATELGASFSIAEAINPQSTVIPHNRAQGLTRALVVPSVEHDVFGGQAAVLKLSQQPELLKQAMAQVARYGNASQESSGGSRAATLHKMRNAFDDARDYNANKTAFARAERRAYSLSFRDLEALLPVLDHKQLLLVSVNRSADILSLLRVQRDYALNLAIVGGAEAHRVAAELAAANVPVILDVLANTPADFDALSATFENAARLHKAGVSIAFMEPSPGHQAYLIRQSAGIAVAHGLPYDAALSALTLNPSTLAGTAASFGRIEKGFDAELVVWDGDPLEVTTFPTHVIIDGKEQSLVNRSTRLRDRYLPSLPASERAYRR